jgi:hypothetical protein
MPFDIQGARNAGATDEQILAHLKQSVPDYDFDGALAAGASLESISAHVSRGRQSVVKSDEPPKIINKGDRQRSDLTPEQQAIPVRGNELETIRKMTIGAGKAIIKPVIEYTRNIPAASKSIFTEPGQYLTGAAKGVAQGALDLTVNPAISIASLVSTNPVIKNLKPVRPDFLQPSNGQEVGSLMGKSAIGGTAAMVPLSKIGPVAKAVGKEVKTAINIDKPIAEQAVESASLRNIGTGKISNIKQATGEVIATGKINRPGLPFMKELSESEARIMKESRSPDVIPFTEYAKQAEIAKRNTRAITPQQLAGTNASKAFGEIDALRKQTGETIGQILENHPGAKIDISDVKKEYSSLVEKRIGTKNVVVSDPSAIPIHNEIMETLKLLPDVVDVQTAQALKQNLRSKLKYDASGQYRPANSRMSAIQKQISSMVDKKLDDVLPGYKEANKLYGQTLDVEDAFSRALGQEFIEGSGLTKHGASIMKRALQSNADSNIGDIFREVKRLTNGRYDLFQDASYANIAMRLSGDPNQWQKAMPFGGLIGGGGGLQERAIKAAGKISEKGKLQRISNWYVKEQNKGVKLSSIGR